MKRVLSLILSIVMAVGMVAGMGTIEVSADSGWEDCYREIIDEAAREAEDEDNENKAGGEYDGATATAIYFLHDMDNNAIPELIIYVADLLNGGNGIIFYTYEPSQNIAVEIYSENHYDILSGSLLATNNGDILFAGGVIAKDRFVMKDKNVEKINLDWSSSHIENLIGNMDGIVTDEEIEDSTIKPYVIYPYQSGNKPDYSGFDDYIAENPSSLTPSYQEPTPTPAPESAPVSRSYDFQFERDNFHALNNWSYFFNSSEDKEEGYIVSFGAGNPLGQLLTGMSAQVISDVREAKGGTDSANRTWNGSCYGMSTVAILNKYGRRLDLSQYSNREGGRAENLYDLCDPKDDLNVKGLINYYQLMQYLPDSRKVKDYNNTKINSDFQYIARRMYDAAKTSGATNIAAILGIQWRVADDETSDARIVQLRDSVGRKPYGHAIMIYGEIDASTGDLYKETVENYGECYVISVYDPNYATKQKLYISTDLTKAYYRVYVNRGTNRNGYYTDVTYDSENFHGSTFLPYYVNNSIETLDIVNYEGRDRNVTLTDYEDSSLSTNDNTAFTVNTASGEEYTAYRDGWLSLSKAIPDSYNEDGACNVRFILPQEEGLTVRTEKQDQVYYNMIYSNCSETIDGYNIDTIEFDPDKRISVSGQDMDYRASLTFDDRTPGVDVIIYEVIGENANNITLNERENGVEITGDNLRDIEINMVRDIENEENAAIENSGNNSVYVEENTIYVDTNADGNYTEDEIVYQGEVDSTVSPWAQEQIAQAQSEGLIPSILQGKDLTAPISRAEFAAVAVTMYEKLGGDAVGYSSVPFSDQDDIPNPEDVAKAYALGITNGTDNNMFAPNDNITREDLTTMLCRAVKKNGLDGWTLENDAAYPLDISGVEPYADDADISDYARESVYYMTKIGVVNGMGDNMFMPKASTAGENALIYSMATREQALVMSLRVIENGSNL